MCVELTAELIKAVIYTPIDKVCGLHGGGDLVDGMVSSCVTKPKLWHGNVMCTSWLTGFFFRVSCLFFLALGALLWSGNAT